MDLSSMQKELKKILHEGSGRKRLGLLLIHSKQWYELFPHVFCKYLVFKRQFDEIFFLFEVHKRYWFEL